jgi:hypothetical protein
MWRCATKLAMTWLLRREPSPARGVLKQGIPLNYRIEKVLPLKPETANV